MNVIDFLQNYERWKLLTVLQQQLKHYKTEKSVFWSDYQYMKKDVVVSR